MHFREMLLLSPHRSLNLPDQPLPCPPLQLLLLHGVALSNRTYLPSQTPLEGWERTGKTLETDKTNTKKGSLDQPECQPHPGVWDKHGQVFIHRHSASKYLFLFVTHSHSRCPPDAFFCSKGGHASVCEGRRGKRSRLKDPR